MNIKDYFLQYAEFCEGMKKDSLKTFCFLDRKITLIRYLKENKNIIIKNINYAFFESDENYLLSVFSKDNIHYIHINSKLSKNFPLNYESKDEYENFLAIYGTFAILIGQSFQIQDLSDSRLNIYFKDFLFDLTFKIYYDEAFRLNLEKFIRDENESLKYVYRYGYDYLFIMFRAYFNQKIEFSFLAKILNIEENELAKLYRLYRNKILIKNKL